MCEGHGGSNADVAEHRAPLVETDGPPPVSMCLGTVGHCGQRRQQQRSQPIEVIELGDRMNRLLAVLKSDFVRGNPSIPGGIPGLKPAPPTATMTTAASTPFPSCPVPQPP